MTDSVSPNLPDWAILGHNNPGLFSSFTSKDGTRWAFLADEGKMSLSGSSLGWTTKSRDPDPKRILELCVPDLILTCGALYFGIPMELEERLWLAGCLLAAAGRFQKKTP